MILFIPQVLKSDFNCDVQRPTPLEKDMLYLHVVLFAALQPAFVYMYNFTCLHVFKPRFDTFTSLKRYGLQIRKLTVDSLHFTAYKLKIIKFKVTIT